MSTAASSTTMNRPPWGPCGPAKGPRGNWSGLNIAAMVAGFVLLWPLGLVLLFWNLAGRDVRELPGAVGRLWTKVSGWRGHPLAAHGDNVVFNDFQQTQHDRVRELEEEIRERSRRFEEFREAARRRADEEEFRRFMEDVPERSD